MVRRDLERHFESVLSVIVDNPVMGEEHSAGVCRGCGNCTVKRSLMLLILYLKCMTKSSAEMRDVGGGTRGN